MLLKKAESDLNKKELPRTIWLAAFIAVEAMLLAYALLYFMCDQQQIKMELEVHPEETVKRFHLAGRDVMNTANILAGPEFLDIDIATKLRRNLSFSPGQMIWFLLDKKLDKNSPFCKQAAKSVSADEWKGKIGYGMTDGVLNFLYDVGMYDQLSLQNWTGTAVGELQASPLLPWVKHLDFIVLSSIEEETAGGLPFITNLNQGMLIISPKTDIERIKLFGKFTRVPNVLMLNTGIHKICDGLWALVLDVELDGKPAKELDLICKRTDGSLVLFSGSGLTEPETAVRTAELALGRKISAYVGDTGWEVSFDTSQMEEEVSRLKQAYPDLYIIPNGRTSMIAHSVLEMMMPDKYKPGRLGMRIKL